MPFGLGNICLPKGYLFKILVFEVTTDDSRLTLTRLKEVREMAFKHIQTELKDGVATLTLNRAPLNVLNIEMMEEINTYL